MFEKVNVFRIATSAMVVALLSSASITTLADNSENFSVEDIESLQGEYQKQLSIPQSASTATISRHSSTISNQRRIQQRELDKYQNLLDAPQTNKTIYRRAQAQANVLPKNMKSVPVAPKKQAVVVRTAQKPKKVPGITPNYRPAPERDAIFKAAFRGDVREIAKLLNDGVNVNQVNEQRETALHMAAAKGQYSTVIYLLRNGAHLHARTVSNWMPIHHATRFEHLEIANFLKKSGASIHAKTSDGFSAIDMAKMAKNRRILSVFGVR